MMHQTYEYEAKSNKATVRKTELSAMDWLKAKALKVKESVIKCPARIGVLNAVADELLNNSERK